jgi:hypothetical protein
MYAQCVCVCVCAYIRRATTAGSFVYTFMCACMRTRIRARCRVRGRSDAAVIIKTKMMRHLHMFSHSNHWWSIFRCVYIYMYVGSVCSVVVCLCLHSSMYRPTRRDGHSSPSGRGQSATWEAPCRSPTGIPERPAHQRRLSVAQRKRQRQWRDVALCKKM